ncbi:hypothetical protein [Leptospira borgpetersenii]|uniref:hypothetical protein n=1 Tax=Leptospira borgpetersenii TaxID=174 RepID=UPI001881BFE9|nr:hypothetical protein [Leptospira borgpetersenii]MBE8364879.1 hypothetical protein [Leptospira borgpetersenii serovar Balcanica]MBE8367830.1 hypothetical protein [Leptospira borgpetersenii serovar Balcanica]MBE8423987.1 hypothetical protein [Leptospira borgpetersenii serovar Balcanica]MBF3350598.1 hypothetical protein [Leptospira borgpetersenii serovar Balcanica]
MIFRIILIGCIFLNSCEKPENKEKKKIEMKTYTEKEMLKEFNILLPKIIKDIKEKKNLIPLRNLSTDSGDFFSYETNFRGYIRDDLEVIEKNISYHDALNVLTLGKQRVDEENGDGIQLTYRKHSIMFQFDEEEGKWKVSSILVEK